MTDTRLLDLPPSTLTDPSVARERPPGEPYRQLGEHLAIRFPGVLSEKECAGFTEGVYAGQAHWTVNYDGVQFTLGRAWYTHLRQDREGQYFAQAALSDALVRHFVPGLQERMMALLSAFVGAEVVQRPAWCGPGVHIFPAGRYVAVEGGDVHFDSEGLADEQIEVRAPALTLVLMLQPAMRGGGLRVWARLYDGGDEPEAPPAADEVAGMVVPYGTGDLVVIDSYRLHQIEPFSGAADRVSATVHGVLNQVEGGRWEAWF